MNDAQKVERPKIDGSVVLTAKNAGFLIESEKRDEYNIFVDKITFLPGGFLKLEKALRTSKLLVEEGKGWELAFLSLSPPERWLCVYCKEIDNIILPASFVFTIVDVKDSPSWVAIDKEKAKAIVHQVYKEDIEAYLRLPWWKKGFGFSTNPYAEDERKNKRIRKP